MARILVLEPGIRQYRAPFFEYLRGSLAHRGHHLRLLHPELGRSARSERDEANLGWSEQIRSLRVPGSGGALVWMPVLEEAQQSDLVIVPEQAGWLHTYLLLGLPRRSFALACWGHGPSDDDHARNRFTRESRRRTAALYDWWFSYTLGTTRRLVKVGVDPSRITTLYNTLDIVGLRRLMRATSHQVDDYKIRRGLQGRTALFLGALRKRKSPDVLLQVGAHIAERLPGFRLLVGGAGQQEELIRRAAKSVDWLQHLGPVFGEEKALALGSADVMLQPTNLGLVVLDALGAGVPLITFDSANHGPEAEYLTHGVEGIRVVERDPLSLANATSAVLRDEEWRLRLAQAAWSSGSNHLLEEMVERFVHGVELALAAYSS